MSSSTTLKLCLFLVIQLATLRVTDAGCPSNKWTQYKDEKCVVVLDLFINHEDAELTCQKNNSTLLSITTVEEQEFLRQLLFTDLGTVDNVWLGAVRFNSTTFRWTDGSPWNFDNWKDGSPSNVDGNDCVQMVPQGGRQDVLNTFDANSSGLWSDVVCAKRNLVVCQRRPTFSLDELTDLFFQHRQTSETLHREQEVELEKANLQILQQSQELNNLEKNPVPLGFVYTQLGGQPEPSVIWPTVKWTQVTQDYAGQFFRAEGGNSSSFGQVQNDQSPRLTRVMLSIRTEDVWNPTDIGVPERGASQFMFMGADATYHANWDETYKYFMSFHNSGGEVRPKNQAIRLWKRTA